MADDLEPITNEPPSCELRFDSLPDRESAVNAMVAATRDFEKANGVLVSVPTASDDVAELTQDAGFRYADQYGPFTDALRLGEDVTILTVLQAGKVVAFGFGEVPSDSVVEIMTIDVAAASRRSADVKSTIKVNDQTFEIGIGHVLVLGLVDSSNADVLHTNATSPQARYIFKSLGFVSTDDENQCLLRLKKN
jgi:hypothetical protein